MLVIVSKVIIIVVNVINKHSNQIWFNFELQHVRNYVIIQYQAVWKSVIF